MKNNSLTVSEKQTLAACEADIEKGASLMVVAIAKIREKKLYRGEYGTFEDYMRLRWGKSRCNGIKLANHGQVLLNLESSQNENVRIPNISTHAAQEISDLPAEEQVTVVEQVVTTGQQPTAANIAEAREELEASGKISGGLTFDVNEIENAGEKEILPPPGLIDKLGRIVPEHLRESCNNAGRLTGCGKTADQLVREIEGLKGQPGAEYVTVQPLVASVKDVKKTLSESRFWTTCPRCNGDKCEFCESTGYLPHKRKGTLSSDDKKELGVE
jgi:hypothetical protein